MTTGRQGKGQYSLDTTFDIATISALSERERAAFKPIYSMNKWWARRSSTVFRAILLSLLLPPEARLMDEFYRNHQPAERAAKQVILDPFMGGGTTIVEALRLGYRAVGVDLNPLAWFIVKTETTPIDLVALRQAFARIETQVAPYIHAMYRTSCPCCDGEAGSVYAFWAKVAPCTHPNCDEQVVLMREYVIGQRRGDAPIRYHPIRCSHCDKSFDWELDPAHLAPEWPTPPWSVAVGESSGEPAWVYAPKNGLIRCPHCLQTCEPVIQRAAPHVKKRKLSAVLCPRCETVFSRRSVVPHHVTCPSCAHEYNPYQGNTARGSFHCRKGHVSSVIDAVQGSDQPLSFHLYAIEGYCSSCEAPRASADSAQTRLHYLREQTGIAEPRNSKGIQLALSLDIPSSADEEPGRNGILQETGCRRCGTTNHRFFKQPDMGDKRHYVEAVAEWEEVRDLLPWPREPIQNYEKTNRLIIHNYRYWHQLFNPRQLLALTRILAAICAERDQPVKDALLAAFLGTLEHQNMLNIYYVPYAQSAGAFGRHDFHPKVMACEGNPWGNAKGRGTWLMAYNTVVNGKKYLLNPTEARYDPRGKRQNVATGDGFTSRLTDSFTAIQSGQANLMLVTHDSRDLAFIPTGSVDHVVTDPPYADAVQYAELSDFFYVWLRAALIKDYPERFVAEETPKAAEIVENVRRRHTQNDFHDGLQRVFRECHRVLKPDGRLVFTFHHSNSEQWVRLLGVLLDAGFELIATYPVKSEATDSGNLVFHSNSTSSIAYDIIHVCQKTDSERDYSNGRELVKWDDLKKRIHRLVADHVAEIRMANLLGQQLAPADVRVMLWGQCLAIYSQYWGQVVDADGRPVTLTAALQAVTELLEGVLVEQPLEVTSAEQQASIE